eukprot:symbB.v1.2.035863.t1/scaffold4928.1/size32776/1
MDDAFKALCDILGVTCEKNQDLKELLKQADNDVEKAVNLYYDRGTAKASSAGPPPETHVGHATKRAASATLFDSKKLRLPEPASATTVPEPASASAVPLAERRRPRSLKDFVGQDEALGDVLKQAVQDDRLPSLILWGPPGCGKTSFAHCVANATRCQFRSLSAAKVGVAELREELSRAAGNLKLRNLRTILFVDELHRWSKAQQDALLLDCERGTIVLIGATTENPSFSLNNAILSRCRLVVFGKLKSEAIGEVLRRAVEEDSQLKGIELTASALHLLCQAADGDARVALNSLELAVSMASGKTSCVDEEAVRAAIQNRRALYDRNGDFHYDLISALHKSLRGGSPDAALYYATRMLTAGEEPRYVTRRLIRFASEDVGLADPNALNQAVAADQAVHAIGMPEAGVVIAQCVIYLALAPKSCAVYRAYEAACQVCKSEPHAAVPLHIRNAPTKMMRTLGYGEGYIYNPSSGYARGCEQGYLPPEIQGQEFFSPEDCEPGHSLHFCEKGEKQNSTKKMRFEDFTQKPMHSLGNSASSHLKVANRLSLPPFRWVQYRPEPEEMLNPLTIHGMELNLLGAMAGVFVGRVAVEARQVLQGVGAAICSMLPVSLPSTAMDRVPFAAPCAALCFHISSCAVLSPYVVTSLAALLQEAQLHRTLLVFDSSVNRVKDS